MADKFWSIDDAFSKMNDTVCLYKGEPFRVLVNNPGIHSDEVYLLDLRDPSIDRVVKYTSDDFDYGTPELGWFKTKQRTLYLCRRPGRFNNVGLNRSNLDEMLHREEFYSKHLYNCIMGIHPTFEEAFKNVWTSGAEPFGRHISLVRDDAFNASIKYINRVVGRINLSGNISPVLSSRKDTLKLLKHLGVPL